MLSGFDIEVFNIAVRGSLGKSFGFARSERPSWYMFELLKLRVIVGIHIMRVQSSIQGIYPSLILAVYSCDSGLQLEHVMPGPRTES